MNIQEYTKSTEKSSELKPSHKKHIALVLNDSYLCLYREQYQSPHLLNRYIFLLNYILPHGDCNIHLRRKYHQKNRLLKHQLACRIDIRQVQEKHVDLSFLTTHPTKNCDWVVKYTV